MTDERGSVTTLVAVRRSRSGIRHRIYAFAVYEHTFVHILESIFRRIIYFVSKWSPLTIRVDWKIDLSQ